MSKKEPILLNKDIIAHHLKTPSIQLKILNSVTSTNDYLKDVHANSIVACIAEQQTNGRGRLDRTWYSPQGENIYCSVRYPFQKTAKALSGLSLVIGLAVCNAIESLTDIHSLQIKWPNDIFANNAKIAGILIDTILSDQHCDAIIGVGINVNMKYTDEISISKPWSSLSLITQVDYDRNPLCATLIDTILTYSKQFSQSGLSYFKDAWQKRDYLRGKKISVFSGNKTLSGIAAGISPDGYLLLTLPDNSTHTLASGEITII